MIRVTLPILGDPVAIGWFYDRLAVAVVPPFLVPLPDWLREHLDCEVPADARHSVRTAQILCLDSGGWIRQSTVAKVFCGGLMLAQHLEEDWSAIARADNETAIGYMVRRGHRNSTERHETLPAYSDAVRLVVEFAASAYLSSQGVLQPVPDGHPLGRVFEEEGLLGEWLIPDQFTSYALTRRRLLQY
jgi:hypothetical protein